MKIKEFIKNKILPTSEFKKSVNDFCGICGEYSMCYYNIISENFNNYDEISNNIFCYDCSCLFNGNFRKKSFYITQKTAKTIKQNEILNILNNIELPCIISFTESNKKHRLFKSKISHTKEEIYITLDDDIIMINLLKDLLLINNIQRFYNENKITKEWILKGNTPSNVIIKIGINKFFLFEKSIEKYRGSRKLDFMIAILNKKFIN